MFTSIPSFEHFGITASAGRFAVHQIPATGHQNPAFVHQNPAFVHQNPVVPETDKRPTMNAAAAMNIPPFNSA